MKASDPRISIKMAGAPWSSAKVPRQNFSYTHTHIRTLYSHSFLGPFCLRNSHQCLDYDGWSTSWDMHFVRLMSFDQYERPYQMMRHQLSHNDQTPITKNTIYWRANCALCKGLRWKVCMRVETWLPSLVLSYRPGGRGNFFCKFST